MLRFALPATLLLLTASPALAQGPPSLNKETSPSGPIAWYGSWEQGLSVAKETNKPILLVAAAPHCHNVSGVW